MGRHGAHAIRGTHTKASARRRAAGNGKDGRAQGVSERSEEGVHRL